MGNSDSADQLAQAMAVFLAWKEAGCPVPGQQLVAEHPECGETLELLVGDDQVEDQPAEEISGERVLGDFRIRREIGRGGMGVVFEAEQLSLGRLVALKLLPSHLAADPTGSARLESEARLMGGLRHEGIVQVHSFGQEGDESFLTMELVEGRSVDEILKEGPLGPRRAVEITAQVAAALLYAHQHNIIHRDVKPSNILIKEDGRVVLTDFGIARDQSLPSLTLTSSFAGTPHYISPEQVSAKKATIDHRTDLYSLGATLYEMLTGQHVFEGETSAEVMAKILSQEPRHITKINPSLPRDLDAVLAKTLEKDPDRRYLTAEELAQDLDRFLRGETVRARHVGRLQRAWRWARREPALAAAIAVVILSLSTALAVSMLFFTEAEASLHSYTRLSDGVVLQDLEQRADEDLWPEVPARAEAMRKWIGKVRELVVKLPRYGEALADIRQKALPYSDLARQRDRAENPARAEVDRLASAAKGYEKHISDKGYPQWERDLAQEKLIQTEARIAELRQRIQEERLSYRFDSPQDQFLHNRLLALTMQLRDFAEPAQGRLANMQERLAWAEKIEAVSIHEHRQAWDTALAAIKEDPEYRSLSIQPQLGLVPLGPDPSSGLQEFAHARTGEIPERDRKTKRFSIGDDTCLVFVLVPGGSFWMGCQKKDPDGQNFDPHMLRPDEGPVRQVEVEAFFLSKYEMTQGQWLRFTGANPSQYSADPFSRRGKRKSTLANPVEHINSLETDRCLTRLGLRQPSENEWEYACRAGTSSIWPTGNQILTLSGYANLMDETVRRWLRVTNYIRGLDDGHLVHAPVGTYKPNGFGFHDMIGNVGEWVAPARTLQDASSQGRDLGMRARRVRGGDNFSSLAHCRSAGRSLFPMRASTPANGCRPARSIR